MPRNGWERWEYDESCDYWDAEAEIAWREAAEQRQLERNRAEGPDFCATCLKVGCTRCAEDDALHAFPDDRPAPSWSPGSAA